MTRDSSIAELLDRLDKEIHNPKDSVHKIVLKITIDNIKFYPPLPELVDGDIIEAEYIEKDNMYYVIDTYDNSVLITEFYLYLLNNHNYLKTFGYQLRYYNHKMPRKAI